MKIKILVLTILISFMNSCSDEDNFFRNRTDFRNYLRDKHPYSELIEIELGREWGYRVNDTINHSVWIYTAGKNDHSAEGYCVLKNAQVKINK